MESNTCFICFSSDTNELINNTCLCKNTVHIKCLVELVQTNGDRCQACGTENGSRVGLCGRRVSFPAAGIYRLPLINIYTVVEPSDRISRLEFAIMYLQTDVVESILKSFSLEDYRVFYEGADYATVYNKDLSSGALTLKSRMVSNYTRNKYPKQFDAIEQLLSRCHSEFVANVSKGMWTAFKTLIDF